MPLYEVRHGAPLSPAQQDALAAAITRVHSGVFTTPKAFVNVVFAPVDEAARPHFVAGRRMTSGRSNIITGNLRHGPTRSRDMYERLSREIDAAWQEIVVAPVASDPKTAANRSLRGVFLNGSLVAAFEAGFMSPPAGQDVEWMKENWAAFQKRADEGDEFIKEMLDEVNSRPEFREMLGGANGVH